MLAGLGRWCARHHWLTILIWVLVVAGAIVAGNTFGRAANNSFTLPGTEAQEALDLLSENFSEAAGTSATVVYHTGGDTEISDQSVEKAIADASVEIKKLDDVSQVVPPSPGPQRKTVSDDKHTALSTVLYSKPIDDLQDNGVQAFDELESTVEQFESSDLEIELGGSLPGAQPIDLSKRIQVYGLIAALVILLLALSTWWSFAWPVLGAILGVTVATSLLQILSRFVDVPTISGTAAVMIGLGVGIDYGLFVVSRFKESVVAGATPVDAAGEAVSSSGRAVLTAGSTVIVALFALLIFQVPSINAMAYAVVIAVVVVVLVAVTLQPAILGLVGRRVATAELPWERKPGDDRTTLGMRWADFVTKHARVAFSAGLILLLVLAIPVFLGEFRLGPVDNSLYPTDSTQYKAWELQSDAFGAGSPNPFLVVVEVPSGDSDAKSQIDTLISDTTSTEGVASATVARFNSDDTVAFYEVIPTTTAQAAATADLVNTLRDDTIPKATKGTGLTALVSGENAVFVDLDERVLSRLMLFVGLVVLIAFFILASVFRSVLIPIKAAVFNVLTILATYGVFTAVFTLGWGRSLLGVPENVPMLSLLAPVVFAVLFGLSNDYEVYFVSRMREEWKRTDDAGYAARVGHARGSRTVMAAAAVMIFVFASYIFQPGTLVKEFGFAMAIAIAIDASVTRMVMLPSFMAIGGRVMWWFPGRHGGGSDASPSGLSGSSARS